MSILPDFLKLDLWLALGSLCVAVIPVAAQPIKQQVPFKAPPLPLNCVRLTGGPLYHAQQLDAEYLLQLQPDRMLAYYRIQAGLKPKAEGYDGWDGGGKNLTGHIAGHYLSAISYMYLATGNPEFKKRAEYIVDELAEVQQKHGNGYCGALEHLEERFAEVSRGDIRSGGFDLNGLWSPWYTLHKTYAGLRDAYRLLHIKKALQVEAGFAGWAEGVLAPLNPDQIQKMLNTEFGAMNEVLADLYSDTGDMRWLKLSDKFVHHSIVDPLAKGEDILPGKHGNTQVPKLLGSLARYIAAGIPEEGAAARFFWDSVALHHSFATGGHGKDEYFGPRDRLNDYIDGRTAESCNVYNMLKFSRVLFAIQPDEKYAAFMERALYNHVLASINPADGRTCYMVPVGRVVQHEYQDMQHSFTCCVGSGMENHALLADGIYCASPDTLWVNLYAPTTAAWQAKNVTLETKTDMPDAGSVAIKIDAPHATEFTLALRRPAWAGDGFKVEVNGKAIAQTTPPGTYLMLKRNWKKGDTVHLVLPMKLHLQPVPDNPRRAAAMWGPLTLAGDLGNVRDEDAHHDLKIPVVVTAHASNADWLKTGNQPGTFTADALYPAKDGSAEAAVLSLRPFYKIHDRSYEVYWDLFTPDEWKARSAEIAAEHARIAALEKMTVGFVNPGMMQSERDFNMQTEGSVPVRIMERAGRGGRGWFSFDLPVDGAAHCSLVVTYYTVERRPAAFKLMIDGQTILQETVKRSEPARFMDVHYPLSRDLTSGKKKVTVRFESTDGHDLPSVFGIRVIRE
jgi:uncharacterized protein